MSEKKCDLRKSKQVTDQASRLKDALQSDKKRVFPGQFTASGTGKGGGGITQPPNGE
jgi:hypothetical protein